MGNLGKGEGRLYDFSLEPYSARWTTLGFMCCFGHGNRGAGIRLFGRNGFTGFTNIATHCLPCATHRLCATHRPSATHRPTQTLPQAAHTPPSIKLQARITQLYTRSGITHINASQHQTLQLYSTIHSYPLPPTVHHPQLSTTQCPSPLLSITHW